ncbi:helix-turn-helix transcriptional regulator [Pontibaca salina]|uniref:HTH domain-containing protein n=1 Tax=Pontibaca salina TaxID=2795731 RepID=A0A934HL67_9RHOB|nr:HTH domain-containing protein [Pontibaca salina]MBI6630138.1 HTH domain-containing protein [Pontibaca salina]
MSRTDRLFDLLQRLRDGKLHRAEDLAAQLRVSQRTLYRYMDRLVAAGVPVVGQRGVGYRLHDEIAVPPLTLPPDEYEALQLGIAIVAETPDPALKAAALSLAARLDTVLPAEPLPPAAAWKSEFAQLQSTARGFSHMPALRSAIVGRQKLRLTLQGETCTVRPLKLDHIGRVWSLAVWCEDCAAFRDIRVDLIEGVTPLPELFVDQPGKRLRDRP